MKILLDAMGGDNAPRAMVDGAVMAVKEFGLEIILVGDQEKIQPQLVQNGGAQDGRIHVVHASEVIGMEDSPLTAVRQKKDSSLAVCLRMLGAGEADALISAGSTGALLTGATLFVKRIRGIRRAALAPVIPTASGGALLIDCGANVECTAESLLQFAYMGYFYARRQMKLDHPRVGLINNGAEESKGTDMLRETYGLLKKAHQEGRINFIGNVEGRDIPYGKADVLVCDGFTGNIVLKTIEGVGMYFVDEIKGIFKKNLITKLAAAAVKPGLSNFKKMLDYKEVGGAPLLGIAKPIIKAHGSSDARAVRGAVLQTKIYVESGIIPEISDNIEHMTVASPSADKAEQ